MGVIKDMRGRRFGRLGVPQDAKPEMRGGHAYWPVICECHTFAVKWVRGSKLRNGNTVSCGCWRADPDVRHAARVGPGPEDYEDEALEQWFDRLPEEVEEMFTRQALERASSSMEEQGQAEERLSEPPARPDDDFEELISGAPMGSEEGPEAPQDRSTEEIDRAIYGEDVPDVRHVPEPGKLEEEDWL